MKTIKLFVVGMTALTLGMLTACNDGFKGNKFDAKGSIEGGKKDAPPASADPSVYESIKASYGSAATNSDGLSNALLGMDLTLHVENPGEAEADHTYRASLDFMFGDSISINSDNDCYRGSTYELQKEGVTMDELKTMSAVKLDPLGNLSADITCSKEDCTEIVVAFKTKTKVALFAMGRSGTEFSDEGVTRYKYSSVNPNTQDYYMIGTFYNSVLVAAQCEENYNNAANPIDDGLGGDAFDPLQCIVDEDCLDEFDIGLDLPDLGSGSSDGCRPDNPGCNDISDFEINNNGCPVDDPTCGDDEEWDYPVQTQPAQDDWSWTEIF